MSADDPRYTASTFLADGAAGWARDAFNTAASAIAFGVDPHTPLGVDPTGYQIGAVFYPFAPYLNPQGAGHGIAPTVPGQVAQGLPNAGGDAAAQGTSWLPVALVVVVVAVLLMKR